MSGETVLGVFNDFLHSVRVLHTKPIFVVHGFIALFSAYPLLRIFLFTTYGRHIRLLIRVYCIYFISRYTLLHVTC